MQTEALSIEDVVKDQSKLLKKLSKINKGVKPIRKWKVKKLKEALALVKVGSYSMKSDKSSTYCIYQKKSLKKNHQCDNMINSI